MRLWLARHARPLEAEGLCYGATDLAVDEAGTLAAATALAAALPPGIAARCSPLQRCARLSLRLNALRPDIVPRPDGRLAEMCFGEWEGRRWDAIGAVALQAWTDDFAHHQPGGGESVNDFLARVAAVFDEARAAGKDELWITHAGVVRAAGLLASGQRDITKAAQWPVQALPFGQWQVLALDRATGA